MKPVDPRVLPHLAPARRSLTAVVLTQVVGGVLLVGQAFAVSALLVGLLEGARGGRWEDAVVAGAWLAAVTVARAVVGLVGDAFSARAAAEVGTAMRRRLLEAVTSLSHLELSRRRSGEVAVLATRGITAVEPYLTKYLPTLVVAATLPAMTVLAIATQDLLSALIVVLTIPLLPIFAVLIGKTTQERADRQWRLLSRLSGHFVDVVRGLPTLVAYRRGDHQAGTIRTITHRYREATKETLRLGFASSAALELVATISVALVAVSVGLRLSGGSIGLTTALVVLLLAPEAYWPVRRVGAEYHAAAEGTATFEEVDRVLAECGEPHPGRGTVPAPDPGLGIGLEGVGVRYPGRTEPALRPFSGRVAGHGVTAVTGPSGCGKSTLLALLAGDLRPSTGTVRVGEEPLDGSTGWREQVAWVPQRPWLLAGSVAENLRLADPTADDAALWRALERVGLGEVVAAMPDGLATVVGEDGEGLSAGQRARVALARAVLAVEAGRPLVLLDEPTAHLDAGTEEVILGTLRWLGDRAAVVVVAHRDAVVAAADHVLALPAPPPRPAPAVRRAPRPARATEGRRSGAGAPATPPVRHGALLGVALGTLASASGVALTATAGWLIARAAEHPPVLMLMVAIVGVRTFGLARPVLRYAERLVSHDAALAMLAERRAEVFDVLVPLTPGRLGRRRGELLGHVVDDVDALLDHELRVRGPVATAVCVGALATAFAAWQLPAAGAAVAAATAVGGVLAWTLARRAARRAEPAFVHHRGRLSALVVELLQGATDLRLWQAVGSRLDAVDAESHAAARALRRSTGGAAAGRAAAVLAAGAGVLAVAWWGGRALSVGEVSGPMLALLLLLPLALADAVAPLADAGVLSVRTAAASERLARLRELAPAVTDPARPAEPSGGTVVTAESVAAGWGADPAFTDLSFALAPGDRLGVVGPSGCGKSTLVALLMRFLAPRSGRLALGGVATDTLRLDDVRATVGLVDDDPHVFGSTLRENLRLARPGACDAELLTALDAASLGPWVETLPDGLDTLLGDGGAHVSGGERARLGLARALLADRPVLVLDEPTAHLDAATAADVAETMLATEGRSIVWITHGTVGLDRMDAVLDLGGTPVTVPEPLSPVHT